ncbi:autotransporter outer membrane beta-barrel domain-containing protein [Salmonella enterica]|uniref:autotransporter outer membrane beta-barrel domain-containing protein n=1 Tax=Salmonella enterica TaxID=28901 RepID=UPI0009A9656A|nr:autotransporter outer membrane beta-barrel domain-containing protein [Salmonella enterica]EBP3939569.1 autotransporter outer membrane beta-barrel domain-containing protein [Salmonella enterica subsp. enterica]AXD27778.1 autotransporter outer membrane beta-barrel domain-containing protein [Salmonella enterica]EAB6270260.1 autotransporter outer membrane beta-barrel domain-containing protein [Salmonella enterica subsp. houtenae]EAN8731784.1 autotransporter outer membrane beta-barrel domain-cont
MTVNNGASLQLNNAGACTTNCLYTLNSLVLSGGSVARYNSPLGTSTGWNTLNLSSLAGNGDFYMHTEVASGKGDLLNITGNATGSFRLFVQDSGVSPTSDDSLLLVKTGGGDAVFTLGNKGGLVELGTWEYRLKENNSGSWLLSPDLRPAPQPDPTPQLDPALPAENIKRRISASTAAVLNMAAVQPLVFDAELESVQERLQARKMAEREDSLWMTQYNTWNNVSTSAGAEFKQSLGGLIMGIDRLSQYEKSSGTLGAFFSYSHSNIDFSRGDEGHVDSYSFGAYAGLQHESGFYLDSIAKANLFDNNVKGRMNNGDAADGDYRTWGIGAHLENGIRLSNNNWSATPYMAFTGFTGSARKYVLSNGMQADVDTTRMLRAEAGLGMDYRLILSKGGELQPWLKISARQELADNNQVTINNRDRFNNDLSGMRGVFQTGVHAKITDNLTGHLSAGYGDGAGVQSPWRATAGMSWSF